MNAIVIRRMDTFEGVVKFGTDHPLAPPSARATVLYTNISNVLVTLNNHAGDQQFGAGEFSGGTAERRAINREVELVIREIAKTAQTLPEALFPGAAARFQISASEAFVAVRANLEAFIDAIDEYKPAFVERGYPETIQADLQALLTTFDAASVRRQGGRQDRQLGTASLMSVSEDGLQFVRELDGIMRRRLRKTNPQLLAVWKSIARVRSAPKRNPDGDTPTPTPAPTTPAPAP